MTSYGTTIADTIDGRLPLRRHGRRWCCALFLVAVAIGTVPLTADDQVVIDAGVDGGRIRVTGEITDYAGGHLEIRPRGGGAIQRYHADQIVELSISQTDSHAAGTKAFAEEHWEVAEQHFREAVAREDRLWVRREILAALVRTCLRQGDHAGAVRDFLAITESDPRTHHVGVAPLTWIPPDVEGSLLVECRAALASSIPAARLVGASYLLDDPDDGPRAEAVLRELSASPDALIQDLAQSQRWRLRLRTESVTPNEIERWKSSADRMPPQLRAGPYYLIGQAHLQRLEYEPAAMALLWLPTVYATDTELAGRACVEAAGALRAIGHTREAVTLYRETISRFHRSRAADEAKRKLDELTAAREAS